MANCLGEFFKNSKVLSNLIKFEIKILGKCTVITFVGIQIQI